MFSWRPIHEETAKRILEFEDKQKELIDLLEQMREAGLNVCPITDTEDTANNGVLSEIDPFSFFTSFNRALTDRNRIEGWRYLKDAWNLNSDVPNDFHAIPVITPQNAWFFRKQNTRKPEDVPLLWKLARAAIEDKWDETDSSLFERCMNITGVGLSKLTTGLF